jgi:hypothetical protein
MSNGAQSPQPRATMPTLLLRARMRHTIQMSRRRHAALVASLAIAATSCDATIGDAPAGDRDGASRPADAAVADASLPIDAAAPIDASPPDAAPPDARPACEGGEAQITDPETETCYELFGVTGEAATWDEAVARCEEVGAHLATITSAEEHALVQALVEPTAGVAPDYWIGGFQEEGAIEPADGWGWVTGEPMDYEGWREGEPNDGGVDGEDCMIIEAARGGTWDDRDCPIRYPFVCERP